MTPSESLAVWAEDLRLALDPCEIAQRNGIALDPWQRDLVSSRARRVFCLAPRQRGKSTASVIPVMHAVMFRRGTQALVVSKSLAQSHEWMNRFKAMLEPFRDRWPARGETAGSITFASGSRVLSVPKGDSARGYSPDILVLDEAAFIPDDDIASVLPALAATRGRLLVLTTPGRRKAGWAYNAWTQGDDWHRVHVRIDTSPRFDAAEEERPRKELGEARWRREHCGEWYEAEDASNPALIDSASVDALFAAVLGAPAGVPAARAL